MARSKKTKKDTEAVANLLASASVPTEALAPVEENIEAEVEAAPEPVAEEKKPRRPRATPEEKQLSGAMENAIESMVKGWTAANEMSTQMADKLEKATKIVSELPQKYDSAMSELFKAPPPKPQLINKIALAAAGFALVLSVVSLSLAQSARSQLLEQKLLGSVSTPSVPVTPPPVKEEVAPAAAATPAPALAVAPRKRRTARPRVKPRR